jgi:hypothetical protein
MTVHMTPAARLRVAEDMAREHARDCVICDPPDPTGPTWHRRDPAGRIVETCRVGQRLTTSAASEWRRAVDALSGVR